MLRSHYYCCYLPPIMFCILTDGVAADPQRIVTGTSIDGGVGLVPVPHDAMTRTDTHIASEAGVAHEATPPSIPRERTETKIERRVNDRRNPLPLQNLTKRRQRRHRNQAKRRKRRMKVGRRS